MHRECDSRRCEFCLRVLVSEVFASAVLSVCWPVCTTLSKPLLQTEQSEVDFSPLQGSLALLIMHGVVGWCKARQVPGLLTAELLSLLIVSLSTANAAATSPSPASRAATNLINTTAPGVNATINVLMPPDTLLNTTMLVNSSLSYIGFGSGVSLFNASFPKEAANTTVAPLRTTNTSIASLIPSNATQNVSQTGSNAVLIADPSWGAAILVNSSTLRTTQLVTSNTTQTESTTVFTTVYNTTTVGMQCAVLQCNTTSQQCLNHIFMHFAGGTEHQHDVHTMAALKLHSYV